MVDERPPLILRPVHGWFRFWEEVIPSLYRVIAVGVAVIVTAIPAILVIPVHWLVALVLTTAGWVALAVIQEHDQRVVLDVDDQFLALLRTRLDPVLVRAGFVFRTASGPARARRDRTDTFLYETYDDEGCIDLWIERSRSEGGELQVLVDDCTLDRILDSSGQSQLARRVTHVVDAADDVAALVAGFGLLLHNKYFERFGG